MNGQPPRSPTVVEFSALASQIYADVRPSKASKRGLLEISKVPFRLFDRPPAVLEGNS